MEPNTNGPIEIELDDLPELSEEAPEIDNSEFDREPALLTVAAGPGSSVAKWAFRIFLAVVGFALSIWAWDFVTGLLSRNSILGWTALALIGVLVFLLLVLAAREVAALSRLDRIEGIRRETDAVLVSGDPVGAKVVLEKLDRLYSARGDVSWGKARLESVSSDYVDGGDLLAVAERELLGPLDARALAEVEAASARVATITALIPVALADVAAALYSNVFMIRRIAEIYGGRSGTFGAWRLTRAVVGHLAATGAVAVGDDLIGSALGGGVLSKLSRRFGEGLINGALTARVGIVAMELCRPMAFAALPKPRVSTTVSRALKGLFTKGTNT